jgi:hypothetical protein
MNLLDPFSSVSLLFPKASNSAPRITRPGRWEKRPAPGWGVHILICSMSDLILCSVLGLNDESSPLRRDALRSLCCPGNRSIHLELMNSPQHARSWTFDVSDVLSSHEAEDYLLTGEPLRRQDLPPEEELSEPLLGLLPAFLRFAWRASHMKWLELCRRRIELFQLP